MYYRCSIVGIQCKFHHAMYKIYQNVMSSAFCRWNNVRSVSGPSACLTNLHHLCIQFQSQTCGKKSGSISSSCLSAKMAIAIALRWLTNFQMGRSMSYSNKEVRHVVAFLFRMFLRHGCCQEIVSDQGREFCNRIVDALEELTGFEQRMTSAYHPQSNGLNECFNQTLKSQLQKLVNDLQDNWDDLWTTSCLPTGPAARIPPSVRHSSWCMEDKLAFQLMSLEYNDLDLEAKCRGCWNCRKSFMTKHMPI